MSKSFLSYIAWAFFNWKMMSFTNYILYICKLQGRRFVEKVVWANVFHYVVIEKKKKKTLEI